MVKSFTRRCLIWAALMVPVGFIVGYRLGKVRYRSVGIIQINAVGQRILYSNELNEQIPMFNQYMDSQLTRLSSPRVLYAALMDPALRKTQNYYSFGFEDTLADELTVTHSPDSNLIYVSIWNGNRTTAQAAVGAIIRGYVKNYEEDKARDMDNLRSTLSGLISQQKSDLDTLNRAIGSLSAKYGFQNDDLRAFYDAKRADWMKLQEQLAELKVNFSQNSPTVVAITTKIQHLGDELSQMSRDKAALDDLLEKKARNIAKLNEVEDRLSSLMIEDSNAQNARLEVISDGEGPMQSADIHDTHLEFAGIGSAIGLAASAMLAATFGLRRRTA